MNESDFDEYKFHDNLLHGISLTVEGFTSELRLDVDHITDWPSCTAGDCAPQFSVVPAIATFYNVTDLCVKIDWGKSGYTRAVSGPYIATLLRKKIVPALRVPEYFSWEITFTDEKSSITFGAASMSFETRGVAVTTARQHLTDHERKV